MKKTYIVTVILIVIIAFVFWYYVFISPEKARKIITESHAYNLEYNNYLDSLNDSFVVAWARAIRRLSPSFVFNGVKYNSIGGTSL